jgi:hypothetical protein
VFLSEYPSGEATKSTAGRHPVLYLREHKNLENLMSRFLRPFELPLTRLDANPQCYMTMAVLCDEEQQSIVRTFSTAILRLLKSASIFVILKYIFLTYVFYCYGSQTVKLNHYATTRF